MISTDRTTHANILSILDGLTRDIQRVQLSLRDRLDPETSERSDSSSRVMGNLEDCVGSARLLVYTTSSILTEILDQLILGAKLATPSISNS